MNDRPRLLLPTGLTFEYFVDRVETYRNAHMSRVFQRLSDDEEGYFGHKLLAGSLCAIGFSGIVLAGYFDDPSAITFRIMALISFTWFVAALHFERRAKKAFLATMEDFCRGGLAPVRDNREQGWVVTDDWLAKLVVALAEGERMPGYNEGRR